MNVIVVGRTYESPLDDDGDYHVGAALRLSTRSCSDNAAADGGSKHPRLLIMTTFIDVVLVGLLHIRCTISQTPMTNVLLSPARRPTMRASDTLSLASKSRYVNLIAALHDAESFCCCQSNPFIRMTVAFALTFAHFLTIKLPFSDLLSTYYVSSVFVVDHIHALIHYNSGKMTHIK